MNKIAPPRFILFVAALIVGTPLAVTLWHPLKGIMGGFDVAGLLFLVSSIPLLNNTPNQMRAHSKENDANRGVLLMVTVTVTTVILVAVGAVIAKSETLQVIDIVMIIATLAIAWLFGNVIYAFHYAHLFYSKTGGKGDAGGIEFPGTKEPNYWDFLYFAATLGMTLQTSDCNITSPKVRRAVIGHCMAAFVFNLGVLAFTINALGS
ncbi:MAG: DUF1345 domain-containing protein [Pseudomonadota bacterium]